MNIELRKDACSYQGANGEYCRVYSGQQPRRDCVLHSGASSHIKLEALKELLRIGHYEWDGYAIDEIPAFNDFDFRNYLCVRNISFKVPLVFAGCSFYHGFEFYNVSMRNGLRIVNSSILGSEACLIDTSCDIDGEMELSNLNSRINVVGDFEYGNILVNGIIPLKQV